MRRRWWWRWWCRISLERYRKNPNLKRTLSISSDNPESSKALGLLASKRRGDALCSRPRNPRSKSASGNAWVKFVEMVVACCSAYVSLLYSDCEELGEPPDNRRRPRKHAAYVSTIQILLTYFYANDFVDTVTIKFRSICMCPPCHCAKRADTHFVKTSIIKAVRILRLGKIEF